MTFGALALAPAGILVPLESVQFVVNIAFNRIVRGKAITLKMVLGVVLVMAGIGLFVAFGPNEDGCFDEASLRSKWTGTGWHIYLAISFSLAAIFYVTWRWYASSKKQQRTLFAHGTMEPVMYTLSSALFGGGQMIVHTKVMAELIELGTFTDPDGESKVFLGARDLSPSIPTGHTSLHPTALALSPPHRSLTPSHPPTSPPANWFFWVELLCTSTFGLYWLFRLSQCLVMYDPLFIIPLMQTAFIIFGAVAAGIFFGGARADTDTTLALHASPTPTHPTPLHH